MTKSADQTIKTDRRQSIHEMKAVFKFQTSLTICQAGLVFLIELEFGRMADADFLISHYQNEKRRRNFIACSSELEMCMFFIPNNLMMNKKWKMCKMAL